VKPIVRSLFLKVFLSFWATAIVTVLVLVVTFIVGPNSVPSLWSNTLTETARYVGKEVVERVEAGKITAAQVPAGSTLRSCLFDAMGNQISGSGCGALLDMPARLSPTMASSFEIKYGLACVAVRLESSTGRRYIFATELPAGPRAAFGMSRARFGLQWGVALLVSGLACLLLTRYLTAPIVHLRAASQELAAGRLDVRAPAGLGDRTDEIGGLVHDFNAMAERIEELISHQRQLLSDISHELRSPLARLNVALDIARERNGNDATFDHMEQDLVSLNDLIGRLLTVAALDMGSDTIAKEQVDLTKLLLKVAEDARFESQQRGVAVNVVAKNGVTVFANPKFLHSAIENVVRNALHYTASGSKVDVELTGGEADSALRLLVSDHGPGVPAPDLANIFKPFFRVAGARDRVSGGMGLGLAITDRIVRLHAGTIVARNGPGGGLQIEILLPASP
jgi:two-component system sensor histidine kinase CpxA